MERGREREREKEREIGEKGRKGVTSNHILIARTFC